ncbi:hypothetical protein EDD18DRAFT_1195126 [Armillaria luteobubalina]|uniref:Uncharacterized protein n=1 Tax=Armillaria luteobubalina TaxID=153913 RepID=A0AA39UJN0_9AGAR|nr:hypothetical protein EDD18DRAFT_1195126 [Armillaria luteobubalina]
MARTLVLVYTQGIPWSFSWATTSIPLGALRKEEADMDDVRGGSGRFGTGWARGLKICIKIWRGSCSGSTSNTGIQRRAIILAYTSTCTYIHRFLAYIAHYRILQ